jgi:hypothetical protein
MREEEKDAEDEDEAQVEKRRKLLIAALQGLHIIQQRELGRDCIGLD